MNCKNVRYLKLFNEHLFIFYLYSSFCLFITLLFSSLLLLSKRILKLNSCCFLYPLFLYTSLKFFIFMTKGSKSFYIFQCFFHFYLFLYYLFQFFLSIFLFIKNIKTFYFKIYLFYFIIILIHVNKLKAVIFF